MRVLDTCAAPGGKSFAAAIAMEDRGQVDARDISDAKLNLVMDGADRLGLRCISCQAGDARDITGGDYDVVIADVPCSGLGVIRKKPDIRYREKRELDQLPELQQELLESIAGAVKPGGRLLYSTCTWRQRENGAVVDSFLQSHPQFEKTLERTFWPDLDGTDGFYICRMERKNEI
jgi:16S rRNA (cytosine967-C5)-methyltransferase